MKSFRTYAELVQILSDRGLDVGNPEDAVTALRRMGYHRLGGYRYPFRQPLAPEEMIAAARTFRRDTYEAGSTLNDVLRLCEFDAHLRRACLEGALEFEVRLRAAVAHVLASRSPVAHLSEEFLDPARCGERVSSGATKLAAWQDVVFKAEERCADEDYVAHHRFLGQDDNVPVWALVELVEFGRLPFLMDLMTSQDLNAVGNGFGVADGRALTKWAWAIVDLRNAAAHNMRLFNRTFKRAVLVQSRVTRRSPLLTHIEGPAGDINDRKLYKVAAVLAYSLRSHDAGTNWHMTFKTAIRKLPEIRLTGAVSDLVSPHESMGFPRDWQELALWNR